MWQPYESYVCSSKEVSNTISLLGQFDSENGDIRLLLNITDCSPIDTPLIFLKTSMIVKTAVKNEMSQDPISHVILFGERPRSRCYGRTAAFRLIMQPSEEDNFFCFSL
jgi:hypothetical protein